MWMARWGVQARNFSKVRSQALDWQAETDLSEGITRTYAWIAAQVARAKDAA